ncbi:unnamed protein product [Prorocentrum cordatum]|uniref:Glycerophosphocholine acyltransferase 1 n=1 Tax=Prorocentrum cordatum TaxID=2364126 RepID=A0ABN9X570_9DINO|nr:unnamed protein product [Polarella glacialis]
MPSSEASGSFTWAYEMRFAAVQPCSDVVSTQLVSAMRSNVKVSMWWMLVLGVPTHWIIGVVFITMSFSVAPLWDRVFSRNISLVSVAWWLGSFFVLPAAWYHAHASQ